PECDVVTTAETLAHVSDVSDVEVLSVQVHSHIDRKELERMPKLRLLVTRSTGTDHVDLQAAAERGIEVHNIPDYGAQTVAEHTLLLLLAV
ncbi:MAG: hydroxyacid dehydrogenase, partial [Armatimonadota bacterium]